MEYTVNKLAKLSGVSVRTLHYYDEIHLLGPLRVEENGYRIYGQKEVDRLQQILFYRKLGVPLKKISGILDEPDYDKVKELKGQLAALLKQKEQLEQLIGNLQKTIGVLNGEGVMDDAEKFEGFKQKLVEENETRYGKELRKRYGDEEINASNAKTENMGREQWEAAQELEKQLKQTLKEAVLEGDPAGKTAQWACELHKQWLCTFWREGTYSKEVHKALTEGYVADERFRAYYEKIAPGCAEFLRKAVAVYISLKPR